jgi:hypothetical protein
MSTPLEYRFNSRAISWCRYFPETQELHVAFTIGGTYRYDGVPQHVVEALVVAPSVGRFFHSHVACVYRYSSLQDLLPPVRTKGSTSDLAERSLASVSPCLPDNSLNSIATLLNQAPILVRVVKRRRSKHGDHVVTRSRGYSIITVNHSGNRYQFLITLLHEIAHAFVTHNNSVRVLPHGQEWKATFGELLAGRLSLFPEELRGHIARHARNPLYSTDSDSHLALMLRKYDTLDNRRMVAELPYGQMFSLDGRHVMTKGELMRKSYRCTTPDGKRFRVSPTARVHTVYTTTTNA